MTKGKCMILGAGLLLVIALIVILLQQQGMATLSRSKAQRLVEQMPDVLSQAAEDAAGRWIVEATADTPALKQVFTRMGIYAIDGRAGDGAVSFLYSAAHPEKTAQLIYSPSGVPLKDMPAGLVADANGTWRVSGLGVTREGYVFLEPIRGHWYYKESYFPT